MTVGQARYKMCWALHKLAFGSNNKFSSKEYEIAREIHSKNMKENHPSKNSDEWSDKVSEAVKEHWVNNIDRKQSLVQSFKTYRDNNYGEFLDHAKRASKLGIEAYREKNKHKIEYKGRYYYSWNNFEKETGVSVHLYKKYYKNGIDPEFRIGTNGPLPKKGGSVK